MAAGQRAERRRRKPRRLVEVRRQGREESARTPGEETEVTAKQVLFHSAARKE